MGDFFDFWIEYKHVIRSYYFPVLYELKRLVENGVQIHYIAGNHDFALGNFLSSAIGIHLHQDHFEFERDGRRIGLFHGDGVLPIDKGYRILRRVLRNPTNQKIYKMLHPDFGIPVAAFFSRSSRSIQSPRISEARRAAYRAAARDFLDRGLSTVIFAHTHHAELYQWGEKTYCNLGNWLRKRNFATLEEGRLHLWNWRADQEPEEILPLKE